MEVAAAPAALAAAVHELDDKLHMPAGLTARLLLLADHPAAIAARLIVGTRDHPALHQEKKNYLPSSAVECVNFSDITDSETSLRSAAPPLISRDFHPLDFTALHHDELQLLMSGSSCSSSRSTTPRVQQTDAIYQSSGSSYQAQNRCHLGLLLRRLDLLLRICKFCCSSKLHPPF